ncbi:gas vesicle protein GvpO [Streptomyces thermodiastaticus]|uniref:gas vesicle protein GvpO n=1 Tax=Streptomyces thermodiastaticus TaxID=44061 RepID=UPI001673419E|nr:gas vesicle protein [Streptomyces thermodiastaticus]MCE7549020.1 gas vesicle protein [Streptomyces thermodiastaticus]GHF59495.1 gas vesicle protein [Streptomyces thermodiastaticus]
MSHTPNDHTSEPEAPHGTRSSRRPPKSHDDGDRDRAAQPRMSPVQVLREARAQLAELTGMSVEAVSSFERTPDGWSLQAEVLELARVPDTMSLMASYEVDLDAEGLLTGYRRVRRYERGRADARR